MYQVNANDISFCNNKRYSFYNNFYVKSLNTNTATFHFCLQCPIAATGDYHAMQL